MSEEEDDEEENVLLLHFKISFKLISIRYDDDDAIGWCVVQLGFA